MARRPRKRLFVLDTNVLMHDPSALFRFQEHDVYLPMVVLEELDAGKKGVSEVARNARQSSRFIDQLIKANRGRDIGRGLPLNLLELNDFGASGHLFFETSLHTTPLPAPLPGNRPDNTILGLTLALVEEHRDRAVVLVSKDINLRIKAQVLGLQAEDYSTDQVLDDVNLLYPGLRRLPAGFWEGLSERVESWQADEHNRYRVSGPEVAQWMPNECLSIDGDKVFDAIVERVGGNTAELRAATNYQSPQHSVWGINARNREQNFALNLLMDPETDFVSLVGMAGTGKTLLSLAAGLAQTLDSRRYNEIIMTRVTIPVGEDIGFLPGTEEEKMTPWMGALMDNLEVLTRTEHEGSWEKAVTNDLLANRIKLRSLNFMRGRTFLNKYLIIDEAQNLTPKQMKTLVTRAGPGTKVVCLGNLAQIDTPYLTETTSGLTYVVDRFKGWSHSGHITLTRGERSRLADFASDAL